MVKVLFLSLLVAMMCGLASTLPAPQLARSFRQELFASPPPSTSPVLEDPATRNERSTNFSYITGTGRKIQLYIKNRLLQILPDGTVNGTYDDKSIYSTLQRISIGVGKMKIQGVSTCQFLCMNCKGLLYASRESGDECEFHESIESNHYNTYYSAEYSNDKRRFYMAINGKGQPRRVMLKKREQTGNFSLGNYSSFTMVLLRYPQQEPDEGTHPVRHHAHMCSTLAASNSTSHSRDEHPRKKQPTCTPKKNSRTRKKKPKCPTCNNNNNNNNNNNKKNNGTGRLNHKRHNKKKVNRKCAHKDKSEKCQRGLGPGSNKPRRFGGDNRKKQTLKGKNNKKNPKLAKHNKTRAFTTEMPSTVVTLTTEESFQDEDYMIVDNSTHWDVDSSTTSPDESTSTSTTTIVTHPD